jgi:two-component system nitrogen regulation response regulator GlnG
MFVDLRALLAANLAAVFIMPTLLVIDDDRAIRRLLREAFRETCAVVTAGTATEGLELMCSRSPDLVLLDVMLPDLPGLEVFLEIQRRDPRLPVVFITAGGDSDTAIEAVKAGAHDYLLKPLDLAHVRDVARQALESRRLMHVPVTLAGALPDGDGESPAGDILVGRSPPIMEVYKAIGRVAAQDVTVLIRGETGTGKELVARAVYQHSTRAQAPFLAVNCAAIPETLLESELFGHEKGSFTGADRQRIGKFEQCSGGTIFLDEIGDLSPAVQGKILRLLQEQRFERVGGNQTIQTDVRIITATHRDLEHMAHAQTFRADLYYRLNGYMIVVPPLRERAEDVELLLEHFLRLYAGQLGKPAPCLAADARQRLLEYPWPGNVREMQSVVRRALLEMSGNLLTVEALVPEVRQPAPGPLGGGHDGLVPMFEQFLDERLRADSTDLYAEAVKMMEARLFERVLHHAGGNRSQAARILGITRGCLRSRLRELQLPDVVPASSRKHVVMSK